MPKIMPRGEILEKNRAVDAELLKEVGDVRELLVKLGFELERGYGLSPALGDGLLRAPNTSSRSRQRQNLESPTTTSPLPPKTTRFNG